MRNSFLAVLSLLPVASPALATGSFDCQAIDGSAFAVTGAIGHVVGSPIVVAHVRLGYQTLSTVGDAPALVIGRSWLDDAEFRLDLADAKATRFEAELRVRRSGSRGVGTLSRDGTSRRVRCSFE